MFGFPMYRPDFLHTVRTDIGFGLISDGPGYPIIHGAGHRFIMGAGTPILFMDQCGFRITNGAPAGLPGGDQKVIMVGHR